MSKDSIKLSPEHGVNPTIPICFWCGKEKNEIALMGKIDKKDSEAPRHVIMDYEPCDHCKELFAKGIQVIGVTDQPIMEGMFPLIDDGQKKLYPTGAMFVATEDWTQRFLTANESEGMIDDVLEKKVLVMPSTLVEEFIQGAKEVEEMDVEVPQEDVENESDSK